MKRKIFYSIFIAFCLVMCTSIIFLGSNLFSKKATVIESDLIFKRIRESVYKLEMYRNNEKRSSTAVAINKNGYFLTTFSIIEYEDFSLDTPLYATDYQGEEYKTFVYAQDLFHNLVILKSEKSCSISPLKFTSKNLTKGEKCFAYGNVYNLDVALYENIYIGKKQEFRYYENQEYLQFKCKKYQGFSGGCVFNKSGNVVGMPSVNVRDVGDDSYLVNTQYSIKSSVINHFLKKHKLV